MRPLPPLLVVVVAVIPLGLLSACNRSVDPESRRLFAEAQRTCDNARTPEDFLVAAGIYQQILDRGVLSGAVYYNQGNAFFHAGKPGYAIAAYRHAESYRPRDAYLEANLAAALAAAANRAPQAWPLDTVRPWKAWLTDHERLQAALAVAAAAVVLATLRLWLRRRSLGWLALLGLFAACLLWLAVGWDWYRREHPLRGVVVIAETAARRGAGQSYEPALPEPLTEGTEFDLVQQRGNWLRIRPPGSPEVWIQRNHAELY